MEPGGGSIPDAPCSWRSSRPLPKSWSNPLTIPWLLELVVGASCSTFRGQGLFGGTPKNNRSFWVESSRIFPEPSDPLAHEDLPTPSFFAFESLSKLFQRAFRSFLEVLTLQRKNRMPTHHRCSHPVGVPASQCASPRAERSCSGRAPLASQEDGLDQIGLRDGELSKNIVGLSAGCGGRGLFVR